MQVTETTFETVMPVWRDRLWPGRISPIEPMSSMLYLGGYDVSIKQKYNGRFFAAYDGDRIVGVNSGHQTTATHYRSRGIFVDPAYTRHGIARLLYVAVEQAAREAGCGWLWCIPRQSSLAFHLRCGFTKMSEFFDEGMEFGPNCYVIKPLAELDCSCPR